MALPPRALQRMQRQHGAISSRQLSALGISDDVSTSMVRRGVLERVHRGVYRLPGGAAPAEQAIMAAVLRAGPDARASGPAACWLHGLEGFERLTLFVLIPVSRRISGIDFPVLHGPAAASGDRARVRGVPAVSVARALLDAAPVVPAKRLPSRSTTRAAAVSSPTSGCDAGPGTWAGTVAR